MAGALSVLLDPLNALGGRTSRVTLYPGVTGTNLYSSPGEPGSPARPGGVTGTRFALPSEPGSLAVRPGGDSPARPGGGITFTAEPTTPTKPQPNINGTIVMEESPVPAWAAALSMAGAAIGAYHGYKRNDSIGWAVGWAILGGLAPVIVIPIAFAQGIDTRKT